MNQVVTPQVQHAYLHPVFAPADLEAAASSTGASRVTGGGFVQNDAATPFLSITALATGQFRLRIRLTSMEGGATVTGATAALGTIQSVGGLGVATIHFVPDNTDAARGKVDITVTCSASVTVDVQVFHRRFLATASAYQTAA